MLTLKFRIFTNCKLYNGTESEVGKIGIAVHDEFKKLVDNYNIVERFKDVFISDTPEVEPEATPEETNEDPQAPTTGLENTQNGEVSAQQPVQNAVVDTPGVAAPVQTEAAVAPQ